MKPDLILVGGGLANCLIAWRLRQRSPDARILILEREPALAGNHTWCFHDTDLTTAQNQWLSPLIVHRWPDHEVRFPTYSRILGGGYQALTSDHLREQMVERQVAEFRLGEAVVDIQPDSVELASGERLQASTVIDGRGQRGSNHLVMGFQKFVGQELRCREPHGFQRPVIMDATVSQQDGYRFVYILPFDSHRLLIEDTRYSDGGDLSLTAFRDAIADYAASHGLLVDECLREEQGVLPILLAGDLDAFWAEASPDVPRSGLAAGLFHPTTGYSLPEAVRLADAIAEIGVDSPQRVAELSWKHACSVWRRGRVFRLVNRMLFRAGKPELRYRVLERFYSLRAPLITRFYAGSLTLPDKARLLVGKPPVPFFSALGCISDRALYRREAGSA
ncbi:lycopene beta-cyclase [Natronocella acetinitrilica]|uniref:Lycopene beta-cyclase n=1 Tax=Natronocella acetinitrilica TaxID=414046 RepID=A0AAE3KCJ0_9GAMM|nr:lycopene beta-cyclase CrtY [Natronocella acetinitrilica]MCP1675874.1 lycopene beta-cyclase [Natronocella acetinitrilica]